MKRKTTTLIAGMCMALAVSAQQPPRPPDKEERWKKVSEKINKEMSLSAAQKAKIEAAYKDFFHQMEKLRPANGKPGTPPPPPPPPPGKKEEVEKLVKARDAKIKALLTETQYRKYIEIEQTLRPPKPADTPPAAKS